MACVKVIVETAWETGPLHALGAMSTRSGWASANAPLVRRPGSATVSVASSAVLITLAVVVAVYSRATPGTNGPKLAGARSVSASVAGTVPPTSPVTGFAVLMRSLPLSIHTLPLRPVTRGAVASTAGAVSATFTPIVIGGNAAPAGRTSLRVPVIVAVPVHAQPVPVAPVEVSPAGIACVTVVVLPSVAVSVGFETVSVSVPVPPRRRIAGLCAGAIRSGRGTVAACPGRRAAGTG